MTKNHQFLNYIAAFDFHRFNVLKLVLIAKMATTMQQSWIVVSRWSQMPSLCWLPAQFTSRRQICSLLRCCRWLSRTNLGPYICRRDENVLVFVLSWQNVVTGTESSRPRDQCKVPWRLRFLTRSAARWRELGMHGSFNIDLLLKPFKNETYANGKNV